MRRHNRGKEQQEEEGRGIPEYYPQNKFSYSPKEFEEPVGKYFEHDKQAEDEMGEDIFRQMSMELEKPEAMAIAVGEVKQFKEKHKRLPQKDEYTQIAESIFKQLKEKMESERKTERKERGRKTRKEEKKETVQKPLQKTGTAASELKSLEIKDLLKENSSGTGSGENNEFDLSGFDTENTEKKCPNCENNAEEIIFCPECGSAFCKNCAKTENIGTEKKVLCPKCGKAVD